MFFTFFKQKNYRDLQNNSHYKHISPIVEETAKEFGVPFIENKTFAGALASHTRLLKRLGGIEREKNYSNFGSIR